MKVLLLSDNPRSSRGLSKHSDTREYEYWRPLHESPLLHLTRLWYIITWHWPVCSLGQGVSILTLDPDISSVLIIARARGGWGVLVSRLRWDVRKVSLMRNVSPCWWSWGWGQEEDTRSQSPLTSWPGGLVWSDHSQPLLWPPGGHSPSLTSCPATWIENVLRAVMMMMMAFLMRGCCSGWHWGTSVGLHWPSIHVAPCGAPRHQYHFIVYVFFDKRVLCTYP